MTPSSLLRLLLLVAALAGTGCENLPSTTEPTPTTLAEDSFSTQLLPGGTAARDIVVTTRGTVSVTLSSTTPAGMRLGLGLGIPQANGAGCLLSLSVEAVAGASPQVSATVETGTYCVKVYDAGHLTTSAVPFTLLISRP